MWRRSALVLCVLLTACGPKPVSVPVAYFQPGEWEPGEIKDCQKAEWHGNPILRCDIEEYNTELDLLEALPEPGATARANRLRSSSDDAKTFAVRFHPKAGNIWKCQRTADGLDCR